MARLKAADARIGAAVADRFPSFNLSGKIGYGSTRIAELIKPDNLLWSLVGDLVQPLIDGGRRKAEIRSKRAQYEELIYKYNNDVLTAFKEVEDALVKNKKTETRLKLEKDSVQASANLLEITREQYVQGIIDYLPLLTAQHVYYRSQTELVSTRKELISNRIELARVLGGGWSEKMMKERLEKE
jgi:outer membrane protein TolC